MAVLGSWCKGEHVQSHFAEQRCRALQGKSHHGDQDWDPPLFEWHQCMVTFDCRDQQWNHLLQHNIETQLCMGASIPEKSRAKGGNILTVGIIRIKGVVVDYWTVIVIIVSPVIKTTKSMLTSSVHSEYVYYKQVITAIIARHLVDVLTTDNQMDCWHYQQSWSSSGQDLVSHKCYDWSYHGKWQSFPVVGSTPGNEDQ